MEKPEKKKVKAVFVAPEKPVSQPETGRQSLQVNVLRNMVCKQNKYTMNLNRRIKLTPSFERPFLIKDDGTDFTPKRISGPGHPRWVTNPTVFTFPSECPGELPEAYLKGITSKASLFFESRPIISVITDRKGMEDEKKRPPSPAPSMFHFVIPEDPPIDRRKILIKLKETPTIVLLSIDSSAAEVGVPECNVVIERNEFIEAEKKRLKKLYDNFSQTERVILKTKTTIQPRSDRVNSSSFSSNWTLYEVDKERQVKEEVQLKIRRIGKVTEIVYNEAESIVEPIILPELKIISPTLFFTTALIMERVLLSNNAWKRQLVFHDLLKSEPMRPDVQFNYHLQKLWTLKTQETEGRSVTTMSWNIHKQNILAVGYGKFRFNDRGKGLVYIWNNKNLANPERRYTFEHPVTSISFSRTFPNILAISFYSGLVILINTVRYGVKIISRNMELDETCAYPVWQVNWITDSDNIDRLIECTGNGSVFKYNHRYLYEKKQIMKISKMKGLLKGVEHPKKCQPYVIPLVRHPGVLCLAPHPVDPCLYYIGSEEGTVYKCSIHDAHKHLDMFLAHNGPVYSIQFHPACAKIFLTCGADWYIRVWGDGIFHPLITMISGMSAVQCAFWCPNNPTVVANITGAKIELWDISRKINLPQSSTTNPTGAINTTMSFSRGGNNLCVGDTNGSVHVYAFKDMPFTPIYSDMVLALALMKALVPQPKLLMELKKLGPPFNVARRYNLKNL